MAMSAQAWVNYTDQRAIEAQARAFVPDAYDRIETGLVAKGDKPEDAMATVLSIRLIKDRVAREEALCWLAHKENLLHLIDSQAKLASTQSETYEATEAHFWRANRIGDTVDPVASVAGKAYR